MRYLPVLIWLVVGLSLAHGQLPGVSVEPTAPSATNEIAQIESVISTLEDPIKRDAFITDLKTVLEQLKAQEEGEAAPATALVQTLLTMVSNRLENLSNQIEELLAQLSTVAELPYWFLQQTNDEEKRGIWREILFNFVLILGAGYVSYFLLELARKRIFRPVIAKSPTGTTSKILTGICIAVTSLIPILAFAIASYAIATVISPREQTRLVALAWVHASIIVRLIMVVEDFLLAPHHPKYRLLHCGDETALFLHIWTRRLSLVSVYGFLILQTASLLGLPLSVYQILLKLLGLLVLMLMGALVVQVREDVAHFIEGNPESAFFKSARHRLSRVWHWITLVYLGALYFIWVFAIPEGPEFLARTTVLTAIILTLWGFTMRGMTNLWHRGLKIPEDWKFKFPNLEARTNRYLPLIQKFSGFLITFITAMLILQVWGVDILNGLQSDSGRAFLYSAIKITGIVLITLFLWEMVSIAIGSYLAETDTHGQPRLPSARAKTLLTVAQKALLVVLSVMSILLVLSEIGVNTGPLLAAAGVLGLAVGFGSQTLVKDVINGFFILLEDLFSVGDVVKVGETAGLVEAVSIRNVRLRDFSGVVHTIPYSSILTISNLTKEFSYYVFDIGVAYRENVDEVMNVMKEVGEDLQKDPEIGPLTLGPLEVVGLDKFADSAVVIKARIKTLPIKQWSVGRDYNRRLKKRFDELGIEIPFPHQTIYFGADKDGSSIPGKIELLRKSRP